MTKIVKIRFSTPEELETKLLELEQRLSPLGQKVERILPADQSNGELVSVLIFYKQ